MLTIEKFEENFNSVCYQQILEILESKANLAKLEQDKSENKHKDEPNRYRDEHLIRKNVSIDIFVAYILKDIENEEQIREAATYLYHVTEKIMADFKNSEFYEKFSEQYGINIGLNAIYANTDIIDTYYDTFTEDLRLDFIDGWKDNPDSIYREFLAQTADNNLVFIIRPEDGDITISIPTKDTYIDWHGNVYVDGHPELLIKQNQIKTQ
ncbi:MAG: hypothetical protein GQ477_01430 [Nanohaloarchaea archaeon]|nr:hypothetical protein [Candidatus Nanohaloarchaea archaeon]